MKRLLRREEGEISNKRTEQDNKSAGDIAHDEELFGFRESRAVELGHEGDVVHLAFVFKMFNKGAANQGQAIEEDKRGEEEGIALANNAVVFRAAIAEQGTKSDNRANKRANREDASFRKNGIRVGEASDVGNVRKEEDAEDKSNRHVDRADATNDRKHDLVGVFSFTIHVEKRNVRSDEGEDRKDHIDDNREGEVDISAQVRRGQAIEKDRIEEEEDRENVAKGNVAGEGFADEFIVAAFQEGANTEAEADRRNDRAGKAQGAKHRREANANGRKADIGQLLTAQEVRGHKEIEPDAEEGKACQQKSVHNDVDKTGG